MSARPIEVVYWVSLVVLAGCAAFHVASLLGGPEPPPWVTGTAALAAIAHALVAVTPAWRKRVRQWRR